jgi:hypothetical protein
MSKVHPRTDVSGARSALRCAVILLMVLCTAALAACGGQSASNAGSDPASAPTITVQPENQSVTAGATATFSVVASGTAPLSYQWLSNGTAIAGATSASYTTAATVSGDSGSTFSVQVSNSVGSATSAAATLTVTVEPVAPSITTQPQNQNVMLGATATFTVVATGTAPLSYQWSKNGTAISGATSASYTTEATVSGDNGSTFSVQVSNAVSNVTSTAATLTVTTAAVAPSITTQPQNQSVTVGATATFSVGAAGTAPFSFQWSKNGTAIAGATSASYTTPATVSGDNGSAFTVKVTNSAGNATSNAATLTVTAAAVAPTIATQPQNQSVTVGAMATFTVVAAGTAPFSYQWSKNGMAISGATGASYTTPATVIGDSGATFSVEVSNSAGSTMSNAATLTVTTTAVAPSITTQPQNQSVTVGATATFTVVASGTAPFSYQWSKNGTAISGATSASYTTPTTVSGDNGSTFSVTVSNTVGNATSNSATLTVSAVAPTITTQPQNQSVTVGATATFTVVAAGTAPLSYQWSKTGAVISGATSASYTTPATMSGDNGSTFSVKVTNSAGSATSNAATLTVNAAAVPPTITTQPQNQSVTVGATATFTVVASGTGPLSYQWSKNGATITGATSASYTTPVTVTGDNGSSFTVQVSNSAGNATSNAATLTVNAAAVPPSITTQPQNESVLVGAAATFTVVATGTAPLSYQWLLAGVPILGATNASYTTPAVTIGNNGSLFSVQVSNAAGSTTSNTATLDVTASSGAGAPILFQHIASSTDPSGSGITGKNFVFHTESLPVNTVAVMGVSAPSGTAVSISDALAGSWSSAVCTVDAGSGGMKSWVFVQPLGATGGADTITIGVGSAQIQPVQFDISFYENINTSSPTDGSLCPASQITPTSGGVISPGSFTPTANDSNGGNVIWNYTPLGSSGYSNATVTAWTAGSSFTLLNGGAVWWPEHGYPQASQAFVQSTSAAVTPSISATGENSSNGDAFNSLTVALKVANNGASAPSTIHVANITHETIAEPSSPGAATGPFPTTGNLRVVSTTWESACPAGGPPCLSSISSSDGCSWTIVGNAANGDAVLGYAQNCAPCPTCTVTLHFTAGGGFQGSFRLFDVQNAAAASYQNEASGNNSCGTTLNDAPTITPSGSSSGLAIAATGIGTGPGLAVTSPIGATFDLWTFTGQTDADTADNADLTAHYYFSSTATQNWNWSLNAPSSCYWVTAIFD